MAAVLTACGGGGGSDAASTAAATTAESVQADTGTPMTLPAALVAVGDAPAPAPVPDAGAEIAPSGQPAEHALATSLFSQSTSATMSGSGAATLSWNAPATLASGDAGGALAGYRIYFGNASGKYDYSLYVPGGTVETGTVEGLTSGTWYFSVAAVDAAGNESSLGYEMSKSL